MKATFVETTGFTTAVTRLLTDQDYAELQNRLMENPVAGGAMPGCGGLRKIRTADPGRRKGRRGGARLIYLYIPIAKRFYMLDIYDKNERDDLSANEKKQRRRLAEKLKREAAAYAHRHGESE